MGWLPRLFKNPARKLSVTSSDPPNPPPTLPLLTLVPPKMSIFERYDDEYRGLTSQISSKISELSSYSSSNSDAQTGVQLTQGLLRQADDLIKQMGMEATGSGDRELQKKTKTYKKTLQVRRWGRKKQQTIQTEGDNQNSSPMDFVALRVAEYFITITFNASMLQ